MVGRWGASTEGSAQCEASCTIEKLSGTTLQPMGLRLGAGVHKRRAKLAGRSEPLGRPVHPNRKQTSNNSMSNLRSPIKGTGSRFGAGPGKTSIFLYWNHLRFGALKFLSSVRFKAFRVLTFPGFLFHIFLGEFWRFSASF